MAFKNQVPLSKITNSHVHAQAQTRLPTKVHKCILLSIMLLTVSACIILPQEPEYQAVSYNVPYSSVAALEHRPAAKKIEYGKNEDQYYYFWPASTKASEEHKAKDTTILFIHGGCWLSQFDIQHSLALTSALASMGFNVYSIEYRRVGNGGEWPVALDDLKIALININKDIALNGYSKRLSILGHSAGGHLASLLSQQAAGAMESVHYLGLAPIIDLVAYSEGQNTCQTATPKFMGGAFAENEQAYFIADPSSQDLSQLSSAITFAGGNDTIVPKSVAFHSQAKNIVIDEAGHFDWIHPGSEAFKQIINELNDIAKNDPSK